MSRYNHFVASSDVVTRSQKMHLLNQEQHRVIKIV